MSGVIDNNLAIFFFNLLTFIIMFSSYHQGGLSSSVLVVVNVVDVNDNAPILKAPSTPVMIFEADPFGTELFQVCVKKNFAFRKYFECFLCCVQLNNLSYLVGRKCSCI